VTRDLAEILRAHGVRPSTQRMAVAAVVLHTDAHPTADQVWAQARKRLPELSRATVYNTLNLLVEKGLLRSLTLAGGTVVFDPRVEPHHHFIDDDTGRIHDLPWSALRVSQLDALPGYDVREYQVVVRGTRAKHS
jgi:Fur family transcriptional regulator, iron response regulator